MFQLSFCLKRLIPFCWNNWECRVVSSPSSWGIMWKKKKKRLSFNLKLFCVSDIFELIGFCIIFICSGSTKIAWMIALLHLVIILLLVIALCHAVVASRGWEKACRRFLKICSVICYQLVRDSLDKLKISQMLFQAKSSLRLRLCIIPKSSF